MQRAIKIRLLPTKEQSVCSGKVPGLPVGHTITFLKLMKRPIRNGWKTARLARILLVKAKSENTLTMY